MNFDQRIAELDEALERMKDKHLTVALVCVAVIVVVVLLSMRYPMPWFGS